MGYETYYELTTIPEDDLEKHQREISNNIKYHDLFDGENRVWSCHEKTMRDHSQNYPQIVFRLHGEGGENGDIWVKWFKDGKMQKWKLTWEEPNDPPLEWNLVP